MVDPVLVATTTAPDGSVPVTPLVVAAMGVPVVAAEKPEKEALNVPETGTGTPPVTPWIGLAVVADVPAAVAGAELPPLPVVQRCPVEST